MKKYKGIVMGLAAGLLLLPAFLLTITTDVSGQGDTSGGISISPTRFEFVIEPGENEVATILVENIIDEPILAKAFLNDFEPDGITGSPKLYIDDNAERSANSLRDFVVDVEDTLIEGNETKPVDVFLQVPENAAPGAYYGAIRFQAASPETSEESTGDPQVALNASVAAIVLVEVPGDITERIEVASVAGFLDGKEGSIFTRKPNEVGIEINNLGNGFSKPFGTVAVNGPWGQGEILNYELNDTSPRGNVLPESSRLFLDGLDGVQWPGRYSIVANISHGRGGEILVAKGSFWYLPIWFLLAVLALVAAIVVVARMQYKKYVTKTTRRR